MILANMYIYIYIYRKRESASECRQVFSVKTSVFYTFLEVETTKKIYPHSKSPAGCLCIIFIFV